MNILRKRVGQVGYEIIVPDLILCAKWMIAFNFSDI